jgi:hypothetical protein
MLRAEAGQKAHTTTFQAASCFFRNCLKSGSETRFFGKNLVSKPGIILLFRQVLRPASRHVLVRQRGNEPIVNPAPRGLPNPRFRRKRPGFANPWGANSYGPIYAEMY